MTKRKLHDCIILMTAVTLSLSVVMGATACSLVRGILGSEHDDPIETTHGDYKPEFGINVSTSYSSFETLQPTGTYTTASWADEDIHFDELKDAYVYSVWYDSIDDNPIDSTYLNSKDAFALKGVFYFNKPLSLVVTARLYKNGEVILTRDIMLRDEVTVEADFSAGLQGWGTFEPGEYFVELVYEAQTIATTDVIEVR